MMKRVQKKNMARPKTETREEKSNRSAQLLGWSAAVGVHAMLLLIFALLNVGWRYDIPEWVEMEIVSLNPQPARSAPSVAAPPKPKPVKAPKPERVIHLPKRRMLEEETPRIPVERQYEAAVEPEPQDVVRRDYPVQKRDIDVVRPEVGERGKSTAELDKLDLGGKQVQVPAPDLGKGVSVPFLIEGEAADRTVIHRVLPQYPPGLAREATVKISFTVLPSGVIASAVPVLKGDAELEKIALEAFRQWRFNPLPRDAEQRPQQGVITFRFVLK